MPTDPAPAVTAEEAIRFLDEARQVAECIDDKPFSEWIADRCGLAATLIRTQGERLREAEELLGRMQKAMRHALALPALAKMSESKPEYVEGCSDSIWEDVMQVDNDYAAYRKKGARAC